MPITHVTRTRWYRQSLEVSCRRDRADLRSTIEGTQRRRGSCSQQGLLGKPEITIEDKRDTSVVALVAT